MPSTLTMNAFSHSSPSPTWMQLPNLRAFSLGEGVRLALIVGSLSFVFLAGQFAQSRNHSISDSSMKQIQSAVHTGRSQAVPAARAHRSVSATERYARSEIRTFSELLDGLTERAEIILQTTQVSEVESAQLKSSLAKLDEDLMSAQGALARYQRAGDHFSEEEVRESLIALQDTASRAQGQLITLDQRFQGDAQGFKVSRIGQ